MEPHYKGHRNRLRNSFTQTDGEGLQDYELLELLLFYSIPRKDVKEIAKNLLTEFKTLQGVLTAKFPDLCKLKGINRNSAVLIMLSRVLCMKYFMEKALEGEVLNSPDIVANFARAKIGNREDEAMMAVYLNAKNKVCGFDIISEGTVNYAIVYPRKIVKRALEKNACSIIIAHNHPSGNCEPSSEDIKLTKAVKDAAKVMDIKVHDHLIVGAGGYFSFVERNIQF